MERRSKRKWRKSGLLLVLSLCCSVLFSIIKVSPTNAASKRQVTKTLTGASAQWYFTDQNGGNPGGFTNAGTYWNRTINNETVHYRNFQLRWLIDELTGITDAPQGHDAQVIVFFEDNNTLQTTTQQIVRPLLSFKDNNNIDRCLAACTISNYTPDLNTLSIYFDWDVATLPTTGWINPYSSNTTADFMTIYWQQSNNRPYTIGVSKIQITYWTTDDTSAIIESQQATTDAVNRNTDAVNNLNNSVQQTQEYLTDDTPPDADTDNLPSVGLLPAGPLDSLLGLPLTLMTNISTALGGSCTGLSVPLPFVNKNLPIPCFDSIFYSGDFAPLATIIGGAASAIILYYWLKHLYKKVDRAISMETTDEDTWGVL